MNIFELQLAAVRVWTDTAQTMIKSGVEAAQAVAQAMVPTAPKPASDFAPWLAAFNPLMPIAGATKLTGGWPFLPLQGWAWDAPTASLSGMALHAFTPRFWLSFTQPWGPWMTATGPFGASPFSSLQFTAWPFGFRPNPVTSAPMWPVAFFWVGQPANPFSWAQQAPVWPLGSTDAKAVWPFLAVFDAFKVPAAVEAPRRQSPRDLEHGTSFRSAGGHATASIVTSPVDIARSIASFWAIDHDPPRRKH